MSETEILSEENIHFPHTFVMEPVFIRHQRVSQNKGSCSAPQATLPSLVKSKKKKKRKEILQHHDHSKWKQHTLRNNSH